MQIVMDVVQHHNDNISPEDYVPAPYYLGNIVPYLPKCTIRPAQVRIVHESIYDDDASWEQYTEIPADFCRSKYERQRTIRQANTTSVY